MQLNHARQADVYPDKRLPNIIIVCTTKVNVQQKATKYICQMRMQVGIDHAIIQYFETSLMDKCMNQMPFYYNFITVLDILFSYQLDERWLTPYTDDSKAAFPSL